MLAALLKGLPGIDAEELDGMLKDLPMPEPGAKGGISVKEAAEVCFICYIVCYINVLYHMLWVCSLAFCPRWTGKRQVFSLQANELCKILLSTRS